MLVSCCHPFLNIWRVFNAPLPILEFSPLFSGHSSRGVLHRTVLLIDVGTQAVKRDTLLECYTLGWNCVTDPLKILLRGRAPPPPVSLSLTKPVQIKTFSLSHSLWWMPIIHTQLYICISNPEGVKVPQFVILNKQQSVYQGLSLSSLKLQGAWMCATLPWFSIMGSSLKHPMTKLDRKNKWSEMIY